MQAFYDYCERNKWLESFVAGMAMILLYYTGDMFNYFGVPAIKYILLFAASVSFVLSGIRSVRNNTVSSRIYAMFIQAVLAVALVYGFVRIFVHYSS